MSRHYRMLQKADREDELFGSPAPDKPFSASFAAPKAPLAESVVLPPEKPRPAAAQEFAEIHAEEELAAPLARPWRESLADVLREPPPDDCDRLALCPVTGMASAAEAAAALAMWIADSGGGSTLIVEANFVRPTLARLFHASRVGLGEAALSSEAPVRFVQDTHRADIKILVAGKRPGRSQRQAWARGARAILETLDPAFNQVVIELPPPGQPEFGCLELSRPKQVLLGVLRPTRGRQGEARAIQREFVKAKAPLSGVLLAPRFSMGDAIRMERLARQFDRPAAPRSAAAGAGW